MKKTVWLMGWALFSQLAMAQVSGVVRDPQGQPIPGAVIEVVGANISVTANDQGEFQLPRLPRRAVELHVKAPRFMHRSFHYAEESLASSVNQAPLNLVLSPTVMEIINVIGLPWHASNMESAQPVNVLTGERLRDRQAATLGDTLNYEVGIHSTYYGPVASSPIIRGLEGPRVLVTQNGLDAGDASRVGPDHAVATEASTARQIEILRGPATLFYGSGAIGGVVNIVDDRVPQATDTQGEWRVQYGSVAEDLLASGSLTTGAGPFALHLDGFWRESEDYRIPRRAQSDENPGRRLANSATEAKGGNLGGSYLMDAGYIGLSYGRLERQYGIPGHSHGDESVDIFADVEQDRVQLLSELTVDHSLFSAVNTRMGYTDYVHREIEGAEVATRFANRNREARLDLFHHPLADWRGALSLHYKHSDFSALGEEAFTPPSTTETIALALMEERHLGEVLLQVGFRIEQVTISADNLVANLADHGESETEYLSVFSVEHKSTPFSAALGAVWDFAPGYNLGLALTHAERTPSATELLSFGPHLGSGLFEVGSLLAVHEEGDGDFHFDLARQDVELEKSNNLDLSLRKFSGDFGFILNGFYNAISNYYYLAETGLTYHNEHHHDQDHGDTHDDSLPVYLYQARDAKLHGFESQLIWQVQDPLKLTFTADYTRARLKQGGNLPRIPPLRIGGMINYDRKNYGMELIVQRYFSQQKTAFLESDTDAYTLVDLQLNYHLTPQVTLYLQGKNLTNKMARVHSSFLKDLAPLPARSAVLGVGAKF